MFGLELCCSDKDGELNYLLLEQPKPFSLPSPLPQWPQGSTKLGIGVKNDVDKSDKFIDASKRYRIIAAEYLGGVVAEPDWLQYMREWGPTVWYDGRSELEKIIKRLPFFIRLTVETVIDLFPMELYGEAGPKGPKEKDNWYGDERC